MMKPFMVTIASLLFLVGITVSLGSVGQADPGLAPQFLDGTIQAVDPAGLNIIIQTDQGKSEMLSVANADTVRGLVKGDRVSVEVDDKGTVKKIVKMPSEPKDVPDPKS